MSLCGLLKRSTLRKYRPSSPKKIRNCDHCTGSRRSSCQSFISSSCSCAGNAARTPAESIGPLASAAASGWPAPAIARSRDRATSCRRAARAVPAEKVVVAGAEPALGRPHRQHVAQHRVRNQQRQVQQLCKNGSSKHVGRATRPRPRAGPLPSRPLVSHELGSHSCCVKRKRCSVS